MKDRDNVPMWILIAVVILEIIVFPAPYLIGIGRKATTIDVLTTTVITEPRTFPHRYACPINVAPITSVGGSTAGSVQCNPVNQCCIP